MGYNVLLQILCMDIDGLLLLMDRDRERFLKWREYSQNFSLLELQKSYDEWLRHYKESLEKYKKLETGDAMKDAPLMAAQLMYFHDLAKFTLYALTDYTHKLQEEYDLLKKSGKSKARSNKKRSGHGKQSVNR